MTMVQMNTRIESSLKQRGDEVLAAHGLSPSQAVRALWSHVALTGSLPSCMVEETVQDGGAELDAKRERIAHGAGLAQEVAAHECGFMAAATPSDAPLAWRDERDALYDDLLDEMEARCGF